MNEMIEQKMLQPYLISNSTILQFSDRQHDMLSLEDVLGAFLSASTSKRTKYYFRYESSMSDFFMQMSEISGNSQVLRGSSISSFKDKAQLVYIEVVITKHELVVNNLEETYLMLVVNPITQMICHQQRISDEMYQEAIEANYSHEQMTPLNSILGNSDCIRNSLKNSIPQIMQQLH